MAKKKRAVWHTDFSVEQCKEIFKEKIPAVYTTPFTATEKYITGEIQDNGDFFLACVKRNNKRDIELRGNLKDADGGGTEITLKYKQFLKLKTLYIFFIVLGIVFFTISLLRLLHVVKETDFINIFSGFWILLYTPFFIFTNQSSRLSQQVLNMFKCDRKKIYC